MIEHERAFILTLDFAKQILNMHPHNSWPDVIEDFYLSSNLRVRHLKPNSKGDEYYITRKTGDKAHGYRFESEVAIPETAAKLLIPDAVLCVKKSRYFIQPEQSAGKIPYSPANYTISIDIVELPMSLAILEIEAMSEVLYPVPATIAEGLLGLKIKECPLDSFNLFRRKIGICGAPNSGKSETAKILSYILNTRFQSNAFHVVEFATTFIQKYHRNPKFEDQFYIWHGQYSREHDAERANIVISDCPTFLSYIYTQLLQTDKFSEQTAFRQAKMYKRVLYDMLTYSDVIFLKLQGYKKNDIRYQTESEVIDIQKRIERFLEDHHITHQVATYNDVERIISDLFFINDCPASV